MNLFHDCVTCGRRIFGASRCSACTCEKCGGEVSKSKLGLCVICDVHDLRLEDREAIEARLASLTHAIDGAAHLCARCDGFGLLEEAGFRPGQEQGTAACSCTGGYMASATAAAPVVACDEYYALGSVRPKGNAEMLVAQSLGSHSSLPLSTIVDRYLTRSSEPRQKVTDFVRACAAKGILRRALGGGE